MGPAVDPPFPLTDTDRHVLSLTDDQFVAHDWDDLKRLIAANDLAALKRRPSDLRRYMQWTAETKAAYGSTMAYLAAHRLPAAWTQPTSAEARAPLPASSIPFHDASDYRVLVNDWPYGLAPGITHLVVWSRTPIPTDPATGDLTPASRALVAAFVRRFFVDRLAAVDSGSSSRAEDRVLWFKNWAQLQSVRQLEHIHVLVRDVPPELLQAWTAELPCHRAQHPKEKTRTP